MSKKLYIFLSFFVFCFFLQAAQRDSVSLDRAMELPDKSIFTRIYDNAASANYRPDAYSNGILEAKYRYEDNKELGFVQDGKNLNEYGLLATGQTVKDNKVFWGKFGYRHFQKDSVRWSDVYDFRRVGPYLIASQMMYINGKTQEELNITGGNTLGEEYNLSGGLSIQHDKWIFGGEGGYLAGHSYRQKDPRPLSTATDLYLQMSLSYNLIQNYQVGLSGKIGLYREKVEVEAENESNFFASYYFKGFGQYHAGSSFSDTKASNFSANYEGLNYGATLFIIPQNKSGFLANIGFNYSYIEPISSRKRSPFVYNTYTFFADLGWQRKNSAGLSFAKLSYDNTLGKGIEHIYFSVKNNTGISELVRFYSSQFYSKKTSMSKLSVGHEMFSQKNAIWFVADAAVETFNERYAYPINKAKYNHLWTSLELGGKLRMNDVSTVVAKAKYQNRSRLGNTELTTNLQDKELRLFESAYAPNYQYMFANLNTISGELAYQHKIKNSATLYAKGEGVYTFNKGNKRYGISFSIGVMY